MATIELRYAYPTSEIGRQDGCFFTAGPSERRHKYQTEFDAINDIAKRHPGAVVEVQFGDSSRADPFRQFGPPAIVVHVLNHLRRPA